MPSLRFAGIDVSWKTNKSILAFFSLVLCLSASAAEKDNALLGYWREPGGSVIHVDNCGDKVCATLVEISPSAPARMDGDNPDAGLRKRTLCGLRIGENFRVTSPDKAEDGKLYDPKSGKTYHGVMTSSGNELRLRGYVGSKLFGRTETWTRTSEMRTCSK